MRHKVQEPFLCLYEPARIKCHYGGRSSGKSYAYADYVLLKSLSTTGTFLCAREFLTSIRDSVHSLLKQRISENGWDNYFNVMANEIISGTGSKIIYKGIRNNVTNIKGIPDLRIIWVEEAVDITEESFDTIDNTVLRNRGSELLFTFNPVRDDDFIYNHLVKKQQPKSIVKKVNYSENKYLIPEALEQIDYIRRNDMQKYLHIYNGDPITNYDSLVYRFNPKKNSVYEPIKYNPALETCASWDFGVADDTAIIFYQIMQVPKEPDNPLGVIVNIIDEYSNNNQDAEHYRQIVDRKPYKIQAHYCDPAGASRDSGLKSWLDKLRYEFYYDHGWTIAEMVDRANDVMPFVRINQTQTPKVYDMFRRWQYKADKDGKMILPPRPCHDSYSHFGTSFYYMIINRFPPKEKNFTACLK